MEGIVSVRRVYLQHQGQLFSSSINTPGGKQAGTDMVLPTPIFTSTFWPAGRKGQDKGGSTLSDDPS